MKVFIQRFLYCYLLLTSFAQGQVRYATQDKAYIQAVEMGLTCLNKEAYKPCLEAYQNAFAISRQSVLSKLRAAFCACQCQQGAVATEYIQQAIDMDYEGAENVWNDRVSYPELNKARISHLRLEIERLFEEKEAQLGINSALKKRLIIIHKADQEPRLRVDSIQRIYGRHSSQMQQLWQHISRSDSLNRHMIEQIISEYGYPGKCLVGPNEMNTAWLVIQHSPLNIQEKYLPIIRQAAGAGETETINLALLIDRIRMHKGQKQLYGTQLRSDVNGKWSFHPIEDTEKVNKRRQSVGLGPIEEYAKETGVYYKPNKVRRRY